MSVKLTILKTGETLISEMQELVADKDQLSPHAYLLNNPHVVRTKDKTFLTEEEKDEKKFGIDVLMTPWIILSSDKKIIIPEIAFMSFDGVNTNPISLDTSKYKGYLGICFASI